VLSLQVAAVAMDSAPPAVWGLEHCLALVPKAPMLAEVLKWAAAKEG
jgi:hypothetical protein